MLNNLCIHRKLHRDPPAALVLLAALAAGRIRSNVTQDARAGRVNTLAIGRR